MSTGEKIGGRIQSVTLDGLTIADSKAHNSKTVSYGEVSEIQRAKMNPWVKAGIIGAAAFGALVATMAIALRNDN